MTPLAPAGPREVLCLGAHGDDIEIGCGGTMLELIAARPRLRVHWVVLSSDETRSLEAEASARRFLNGAADATVEIHTFRESCFPYNGGAVKDFFEELKARVSPDLIFTHARHDLHQDHRLTCELTWNTFRDHLILEYEIPKWDGDLGSPNLFVPLSPAACRRKVGIILESFTSQKGRHWFDGETFLSLMRLRGVECAAPQKYAEGFYARKLVLDAAPAGAPAGVDPGLLR